MIWRELTGEQSHQRRLAGSVAAKQADALIGFYLASYSIEQRRAMECNGNLVKTNQRGHCLNIKMGQSGGSRIVRHEKANDHADYSRKLISSRVA
jgi:hypothetical protein